MLQSSFAGFSDARGLSEPIRYLPPLDLTIDEELEPAVGSQVLPCFPLKSLTPVPSAMYKLKICEPRYRRMYNDILMSGGRRFVVPFQHKDSPRSSSFAVESIGERKQVLLAAVGVVFYLDDLNEVSAQTDDEIKYVGRHSVIGRVQIKQVLNPRAFADGLFGPSTYLRLEVEDLVDVDLAEDTSQDEDRLAGLLEEVGVLQKRYGVEQFRPAEIGSFNVTRGPGFWGTLRAWQSYLSNRMMERHRSFDRELRQTLLACRDLPEVDARLAVQRNVSEIRERLWEDVEPLVEAQGTRIHQIVQSERHKHRLDLFEMILEEERRRLLANLALQDVFLD